MFYYFLALIHIFVCVVLVFFILIQSNKGMGLSGAFGSMGAGDSVFGASGSFNILVKITIGLAIIFTLSNIIMNIVQPPSAMERSIMMREQATATGGSLSEIITDPSGVEQQSAVPDAGALDAGAMAPADEEAPSADELQQ